MTEQGKVTIKVKPETKLKLERFQSKYHLKTDEKLDNDKAIALAVDTATKALDLDDNGDRYKTPSPDEKKK